LIGDMHNDNKKNGKDAGDVHPGQVGGTGRRLHGSILIVV
jgi:hypothetical protein